MRMPRVLTRLGADVERALTDVNVPAYVIDKDGILVWLNPSAEQLVGDARGKRFTDVVAPSDRPRAKRMFARKLLGTVAATDSVGDVLRPDGTEATVEVSSVPLLRDHQVIGVFGLVSRPPERPSPIVSHPHLTPRQLEVLRMLAHGASTDQIAESLHITRETVRNHVRHILRKLGVHSRLEAIAAARAYGELVD
jgi:PAS domain S-box-containing protein